MSFEDFVVKVPEDVHGLPQDREYCYVEHNGTRQKIRFHDYHEIYRVEGLYEQLFYDLLECCSPEVVTTMMTEHIPEEEVSDLVVLDMGAGNGMVGEALANRGVNSIVGVDIIEEAAHAAERDRPDIYDDYFVADLCNLPAEVEAHFEQVGFKCLTCVAALGFGDIPPLAFANAYNFMEDDGWAAFNIKEDFVKEKDSPFACLIDQLDKEGILEFADSHRYQHRLALDGTPLYYMAMIGQKRADIPQAIIEQYQ